MTSSSSPLAVIVRQAQKVQHVGVAEHQLRRHLPTRAQGIDFRLHHGFRLLGDGRAQVQLAGDALAQGARAPAFHPARLGVVRALQRLLERQDFDEVAPAQFFCQRYDNRVLWKNLGKLDHARQIAGTEALAVVGNQFCRQCRQNLFAVFRTLVFQHLALDTLAHMPVDHRQCGIGGLRDVLARGIDQTAQFLQQTNRGRIFC